MYEQKKKVNKKKFTFQTFYPALNGVYIYIYTAGSVGLYLRIGRRRCGVSSRGFLKRMQPFFKKKKKNVTHFFLSGDLYNIFYIFPFV